MSLNFDFNLEPKEAVNYLASKGLQLSFNYEEMMHEMHHKAFTVAKITRLDLLQDIHTSLIDAQKNGTTFEQWKKQLKPTLQKKGWWGKTEVINRTTGEVKNIYVGSRRLRTIFDTNMRVSYSVGRHQQLMGLPDSVYWRYVSILDSVTRPSHAGKNGIIKHRDDPWWKTNYPPNAWNCRCKVRAYRQDEIDAKGWEIHQGAMENIAHPDWAYDVGAGSSFEALYKKKLESMNCGKNFADKPCAQALFDLAKQESIVDADRFKKWFQYPKNTFDIANTTARLKKSLTTKAATISISAQTIEKQKRRHPELEWYEYLLLHSMFTKPLLMVKDGDRTIVAVKSFLDEAYYYAAIKSTRTGKAVFVTSFRKAKDIDDLEKKGEVIYDRR
jgi:SPP1 gp7 family putative phage head morphogenesis protein